MWALHHQQCQTQPCLTSQCPYIDNAQPDMAEAHNMMMTDANHTVRRSARALSGKRCRTACTRENARSIDLTSMAATATCSWTCHTARAAHAGSGGVLLLQCPPPCRLLMTHILPEGGCSCGFSTVVTHTEQHFLSRGAGALAPGSHRR